MHRATFAVTGDHPEAAAGQPGEGLGIVGRSWHDSRIRNHRLVDLRHADYRHLSSEQEALSILLISERGVACRPYLVWAPLGDLGVCESGNVGGVELLEFIRGAPI
jgi:hypothetical protein